MGETKIEWTATFAADGSVLTKGYTFNAWWGCAKVSEACASCYAEGFAKRLGKGDLWRGRRERTSAKNWSHLLHWNRQARDAGQLRQVFAFSMADVLEDLGQELDTWRGEFFELAEQCTSLRFLLLTKRPENGLRMFPRRWLGPVDRPWWEPSPTWPRNVWVGTTVETQGNDTRIGHLLQIPTPVPFLSIEPLLGPLDLDRVTRWADGHGPFGASALSGGSWGHFRRLAPETADYCNHSNAPKVRWVIVGTESGPRRRPTNPDWIRKLRDQCVDARVPFFLKQADLGDGRGLVHLPELDGRRWTEQPFALHTGR